MIALVPPINKCAILRYVQVSTLKADRLLVKVNRLSGWLLLIFMVIFFISGYSWRNRTLLPLQMARWMHTELDLPLLFLFLVHSLTSIRFALARWRIGHGIAVDLPLTAAGVLSFWFVLSIR